MAAPEEKARMIIDRQLQQSGWIVQDLEDADVSASRGVAIREFKLKPGHGRVDYLLFIDGQAVGVLEAKKLGFTLGGVEGQALKYSEGLPDELDAPHLPLPFCYLATGAITKFSNHLDPDPRTRGIFQFHRPDTLAEWLSMKTLNTWVEDLHPKGGLHTVADDTQPSTLRARLQTLPALTEDSFLYPNQVKAVTRLEQSLKRNKPRALIQMSTGSGKTITASTAINSKSEKPRP